MSLVQLCFWVNGSGAEEQNRPDAVIIYTGDIRGYLTPAGCCSKLGGIARRGTKIDALRQKFKQTIVLDSGDYIRDGDLGWLNQLKIDQTARAFKLIQYDALNLADFEIMAGEKMFNGFLSEPTLPITSLNVRLLKKDPSLLPPYLIKRIGKFRFAIIGLVSEHFLKGNYQDSIEIDAPLASLKHHLPEIRQQSDFIILMSHMGMIRTKKLLNQVADIDIAIVGHGAPSTYEPEMVGNTKVLKNTTRGGTIGTVKLWINNLAKIERFESGFELLDMNVQPMEPYAMLEKSYVAEKKALSDPNHLRRMEEAKEVLKLTPEEFLTRWKKNKEN